MSEQKHSPEPWYVAGDGSWAEAAREPGDREKFDFVIDAPDSSPRSKANVRRAVACVNMCRGVELAEGAEAENALGDSIMVELVRTLDAVAASLHAQSQHIGDFDDCQNPVCLGSKLPLARIRVVEEEAEG